MGGFDLRVAFNPVSHEWLFIVLRALGFPSGFCDVIAGLLRGIQALFTC